MFQGSLKIWKKDGEVYGSFTAPTPYGNIEIVAQCPFMETEVSQTADGLRGHRMFRTPDGKLKLDARFPIPEELRNHPVWGPMLKKLPKEKPSSDDALGFAMPWQRGNRRGLQFRPMQRMAQRALPPAQPSQASQSDDGGGDDGDDSAQDDSMGAFKKVRDELSFAASFFKPQELIGEDSASAAKILFKKLGCSDQSVRSKARAQLKQLEARAKTGNGESRDILYGISRLASVELARRAKQKGVGDVVIGYDWRGALQALKKMAKIDADTFYGFKLFKLETKNKDEAEEQIDALRESAENGDKRAQKSLAVLSKLHSIEKEKRRETVMGNVVLGESFWKKLGRGIEDVAKAAVPILEEAVQPLASMIPVVGPSIAKGIDMIQKASAMDKDAMNKIQTVKTLAAAGVPAAVEAKKNLVVAQKLINKTQKAAEERMNPGKVKQGKTVETSWAETPAGIAAAKKKGGSKESKKERGPQDWRAENEIPLNLYRAGTMMRV